MVTSSKGEVKLQVENLHLSFGGVQALEDVSMEIKEGEILAIIGPNGAGKTCILNCVSGFYHPQEGRVCLEGENITGFPTHKVAARGVGRTFQSIQLYLDMTAVENILGGRHSLMKGNVLSCALYWPWVHREEVEHRRRVEQIIDFLEIEAVRKMAVGTIGYGLRKRVDLARALALEPRLLLLDEPMAGMNLEEKEDMVRFVLDIRDTMKIPIVLVEHDMEVVLDIADRVIVLDWGRKIAEGSPEEIKVNPHVIKAYLGAQEEEAS